MNTSPDRGTFHIDCQLKQLEDGKTSKEKAEEMIDFYKTWDQQRKEVEQSTEWREYNMEYDLRSTSWICDKVKASESYAQNLYAAICNNDFTKNEVWPTLQGKTWSASWRSAGGIIAHMREEGDYIDWYCSGIRNPETSIQEKTEELTEEQLQKRLVYDKFVSESVVTDEIREDLLKLGWVVLSNTVGDY